MNNKECKYCGSTKKILENRGVHKAIMCGECGKHQKFATKEEIPSTSGLATEQYVNETVSNSGFQTETQVNTLISNAISAIGVAEGGTY